MLGMILSLVTKPLFNSILEGWKAKLTADTDQTKLAGDLAARELAVQQAELQAQNALKRSEVGHPFEVEKLFAYATLIYYTKVLVYDEVLQLGSTHEVHGVVAVWAGMIMSWYFGKRTIETALRIWRRQ